MLDYGTKIVAGVTPGKAGRFVHGIPVYDTVADALKEHDADASVVFVPAPFALDASLEAVEAGLNPIVIITEHIPIHDSIKIINIARRKCINIIGPNTPGVITPNECKLGVMPPKAFSRGPIGVVSRSGTLTYEVTMNLKDKGLGQSTCIGLGGDPVTGLDFVQVLRMFNEDLETKAVVLIGEVGGEAEELAADFIKRGFEKPVVAFIAGRRAPPERRIGHAGAIIRGSRGTAESKIEALTKAGVEVAYTPSAIADLLTKLLQP